VDHPQDESDDHNAIASTYPAVKQLDLGRRRLKLGKHINTSANEYLPVLSADASVLYFSAMDRTGFFDFKIDFVKAKSAGGEDIFFSEWKDGVWMDARPLESLNTNAHEVLTQVLPNGDFIVTANYPEKLGPVGKGNSFETTDLFKITRAPSRDVKIQHFPEPVNSIFNEADGWMGSDESFILFVSDRPGHVGEYQRKGWIWNNSLWGNTDVYVALKEGDSWGVPKNLGTNVNTPFAERTPWLSGDGLTLYLSSSGYIEGKEDLDVYAFKRTNKNNWDRWEGPYLVMDVSTKHDDWGYKESADGLGYVASAVPKGFMPTQRGVGGDAGFRETNFRSGYEIFGQQVAALEQEYVTHIYVLGSAADPVFTLPDLFFEFDAADIKPSFLPVLDRMLDQIKENPGRLIEIHGFTDDVGSDAYNRELSKRRAATVVEYFRSQGVDNEMQAVGRGKESPVVDNQNVSQKHKNRRVVIYIRG
jgi:outer membrane protein OmpA-like peptidoglycan-associated protein